MRARCIRYIYRLEAPFRAKKEMSLFYFSAILGFLRDARRLIVAIMTRTKRGLLWWVMGCPTVLKTCRHWAALLKRGCGCSLIERECYCAVDTSKRRKNALGTIQVVVDDSSTIVCVSSFHSPPSLYFCRWRINRTMPDHHRWYRSRGHPPAHQFELDKGKTSILDSSPLIWELDSQY